MSIAAPAITPPAEGISGRLSDVFWRNPKLLLFLLLLPPVLWLGI
ncbi:MAG TPA: ABC transporter permease, partial [Rhizobiaceae bacterium]|nr:ABC transporter permease [Rhizobiaceae bacterium]